MPYTADLPVVSNDLLTAWAEAGNAEVLTRVRVAESPAILGPGRIGPFDLRVWRGGVTPAMRHYADAALPLMGETFVGGLQSLFEKEDRISLDRGTRLIVTDKSGQLKDVPAGLIATVIGYPGLD